MLRPFLLPLIISISQIPFVASYGIVLPSRLQHKSHFSRRTLTAKATDNIDDANPDLVGVHVDGYPLPSTPCRPDDEELMNYLQSVPGGDLFDLDEKTQSNLFERRTLTPERPLRILVAGGGLGGLATASALLRKGYDVHVLEQVVQYRAFGGPIQLQSNALWALQQIAPELFEAIQECGVQTGDRLSGIKDGVRYKEGWLVKFDAATPAREKGLPLTLAINRVVLQEIFLKYGVPPERVHTKARVISYNNTDDHGVAVTLENGETVWGDILVGADGIWSQVRHQMCGLPNDEVGIWHATKHASYSGYTCFTGTCRHVPDDIETVAYKVFLGQKQYLGCTDAGHGWQHWWAFLPDAPSTATMKPTNTEADGKAMLERLVREFSGWSPEIHDLFQATKPEVVRQRDLFDRKPMWNGWTDRSRANVVLLGGMLSFVLPIIRMIQWYSHTHQHFYPVLF